MNSPALRAPSALAALRAFTMVEAVVAIAVLGVGVASTVGVVTKMNQFAAQSRNMTGANAIVQTQIDIFQTVGPFKPPYQTAPSYNPYDAPDAAGNPTSPYPAPAAVPKFTEQTNNPNNYPSYDLTAYSTTTAYPNSTAVTIGYKNPATGVVTDKWPVYQYQDATGAYIVVTGTLNIQVTDISPSTTVKMYQGVVTLTYTYLNRNYTVRMTAIRSSDT